MSTNTDTGYSNDRSAQIAADMTAVSADAAHGLPPGAQSAVAAMTRAADSYVTEVADVETNWARLVDGAAEYRLHEAATVFDDAVESAATVAQAEVTLEHERLTASLLPKPPSKAEDVRLARDELQLLTEGKTGAKLIGALAEIAGSARRDLAGTILSPWGESLISARGGDPAKVLPTVREMAAAGTAKYGTDAETATYLKLAALPKTAAAAIGGARVAATARRQAADRNRRNKATATHRIANRAHDAA